MVVEFKVASAFVSRGLRLASWWNGKRAKMGGNILHLKCCTNRTVESYASPIRFSDSTGSRVANPPKKPKEVSA